MNNSSVRLKLYWFKILNFTITLFCSASTHGGDVNLPAIDPLLATPEGIPELDHDPINATVTAVSSAVDLPAASTSSKASKIKADKDDVGPKRDR